MEIGYGRPMQGIEMPNVRHVVDDLDRMGRQGTEIVEFPSHPIGSMPFIEFRRLIMRHALFWIVPHEDAAHAFAHRPGSDRSGLRNRSLEIWNVVAAAIRAETPRMIGTANAVALDLLAVLNDEGCRTFANM